MPNRILAAALPLLVLVACASSRDKTGSFLVVQGAERVTLTDSTVTLRGVSPTTIYFSDRPQRIVGHVPTKRLVAEWGKGPQSFAKDPPNATLSVLDGERAREAVLVLHRPRFEGDALVYDVTVLSGHTPVEGGPCSLFIDNATPFGEDKWNGPIQAYRLPRKLPPNNGQPWGGLK